MLMDFFKKLSILTVVSLTAVALVLPSVAVGQYYEDEETGWWEDEEEDAGLFGEDEGEYGTEERSWYAARADEGFYDPDTELEQTLEDSIQQSLADYGYGDETETGYYDDGYYDVGYRGAYYGDTYDDYYGGYYDDGYENDDWYYDYYDTGTYEDAGYYDTAEEDDDWF